MKISSTLYQCAAKIQFLDLSRADILLGWKAKRSKDELAKGQIFHMSKVKASLAFSVSAFSMLAKRTMALLSHLPLINSVACRDFQSSKEHLLSGIGLRPIDLIYSSTVLKCPPKTHRYKFKFFFKISHFKNFDFDLKIAQYCKNWHSELLNYENFWMFSEFLP